MVAHGLITGTLFLLTGSLWQRAGTYEIAAFGGLAARAPAFTLAAAVATFASLGLPGLAGFVAEFQIFVGTFGVYPWLAAIGLVGILITAALFLQLLQRIFLGALPQRWATWQDLAPSESIPVGVLLLLVLAIGIAPAPLLHVIDSAVRPLVQR
jgi:NADH-quinone oxidoreductase subunit M